MQLGQIPSLFPRLWFASERGESSATIASATITNVLQNWTTPTGYEGKTSNLDGFFTSKGKN